MAALQLFRRRVPGRAIIGIIGDDAPAISRGLGNAGLVHWREVVVVDYVLDTQNPLARMRSQRDLTAARHQGATVLLASYREELLRELCDEIWWIQNDEVIELGDPAEMLVKWRRATVDAWHREQSGSVPPMAPSMTAGDGRAHIRSIELLNDRGQSVGGWLSGEPGVIRVVIEFLHPVAEPVIGMLIRTRIGLNVYGTNTELESLSLGPRSPSDSIELLFRFPVDLCPGEYTLTIASHDPDGIWHEWLEDVLAFTVADTRYTAGIANLRARVDWKLLEDS